MVHEAKHPLSRSFLIAASLFIAAPALAQHRDVQVYLEEGVLKTGAVEFEQPGQPVTPDVRVFQADFGEAPNGTDDPGYNAAAAALPQGTIIGFNILDALRKWDGADFDAIPPERIFIGLGANNRQTPTTPDTTVIGFNIVQAGGGGGFHQHMNYFLLSPSSPGVYLLKLELKATGGFVNSDPIYIVFGQSAAQADQDAAVAYVQDVLIAPAICPGDANGDNVVEFADIAAALVNYNASGEAGILGDADRNGLVDFADIGFILVNWGSTCP